MRNHIRLQKFIIINNNNQLFHLTTNEQKNVNLT
jgi:hypothetical protein